MKKFLSIVVSFLAVAARASPVDVTATASDVSSQITSVVAVGVAVLAIFVSLKGFAWVKAVMLDGEHLPGYPEGEGWDDGVELPMVAGGFDDMDDDFADTVNTAEEEANADLSHPGPGAGWSA